MSADDSLSDQNSSGDTSLPTQPTIHLADATFHLLFPELIPTPDEEDRLALTESIRNHGITVPVVVDEQDGVIDGGSRLRIAEELGFTRSQVPLDVRTGLTWEEKQELALVLNSDRRHLAPEVKRELRRQRVMHLRRLGYSLRHIAEVLGIDKRQVHRDLQSGGDTVPTFGSERILGRDNKSYPAHPTPPVVVEEDQPQEPASGTPTSETEFPDPNRPHTIVVQVATQEPSEPVICRPIVRRKPPENSLEMRLRQRAAELGQKLAGFELRLGGWSRDGSEPSTDPAWIHQQALDLEDVLGQLKDLATLAAGFSLQEEGAEKPTAPKQKWSGVLRTQGQQFERLGKDLVRVARSAALRNDREKVVHLIEQLAQALAVLRHELSPVDESN